MKHFSCIGLPHPQIEVEIEYLEIVDLNLEIQEELAPSL